MLTAHEIRFGYFADRPIIDSFSDDFYPGEVVALTGPSGRGKSTLLYILGLMLRPDSGSVRLGEEPVSALSDGPRAAVRAARFGFVFQDAALDATRTVIDNVLEVALYRGLDADEWRDHAQRLLADFGVDLDPWRRPGQVSGGQAQRIALVRALIGDPEFILADEPTGNLDAATSDLVFTALRARADAGATVIVATHDPAFMVRCDRQVQL